MPAHGRPRAIGTRISGHLRSAAPASFRRLYLRRAWRRLGLESNRSVGAVRRTHLLVTRLAGQLSVKPTVRPRGLAWLLVSTAVTGVSREESCQFSRPALPYATEHSPVAREFAQSIECRGETPERHASSVLAIATPLWSGCRRSVQRSGKGGSVGHSPNRP
jgi:hypothetical protein